MIFKQITGDRVTLRTLTPQDFDELYLVASDPKIWEQHPRHDRYKQKVFEDLFFNTLLNLDVPLAVIDNKSRKIIGSSSFYEFHPENSSIVIGYTFLAREAWGTGINTEVKRLMINHAFEHAREVHFHVGETNLRSRKSVEKTGAKVIETISKKNIDGSPRKVLVYSLTKK